MESSKPQPQQEGPYGPDQIPPLVFEGFDVGLDTNSTRVGIKDNACWWLDGFMYVGPNYIRTMYGVGAATFAAPTNTTVSFFDFFNIGTTPYMCVIISDGSIWVVNTSTLAAMSIAPAGTIQNPSRQNVGVSQWGSQYLLIVSAQTNGYYIWDGVNLYTSGTVGPTVTIDNDGYDYTSPPTITPFGGSGSGVTFSSTLIGNAIQNISVQNPGAGFVSDDVVGLAFSGGGSRYSTAIVYAHLQNGTVSGTSISNNGYGYRQSTAQIQFLGGGGFGATATVSIVDHTVNSISIMQGGQGYTSPPTVYVVDSSNPVAVAVCNTMPFGLQGTAVETYNSQVWIANGTRITFSAPESTSDFSTADGGGSFLSTDSFLRVGYSELVQSNGFLWLIGDSSINYISGVQTSGSPATTTFTNQNADPEIGTVWPATIDVFSRNILLANAFGAHVSYGGAVTKISENLDGIYNSVPNFGGFVPSAAKAIVFGKHVWALLLPVVDQITGQQVNKLFMWNGKQWWSTQQDVPLIYIQHQEINSVLTAYGSDGNTIFPLFQNPTTGFTKTVRSKLWATPGGYQYLKTADRLWGLAQYFSPLSPELDISIDNETGSSPTTYNVGANPVSWIDNSNEAVTWENNSLATVGWISTSNGIVVFPPQAVAQVGALLGLTVETDAADMALISLMVAPQIAGYRG